MNERSGLLFDLDGTMLDTDPLHFAAFCKLLEEFDMSITEDYYNTRIMGAPIMQIMAELFPSSSADEQWKLGERKEALFRNQLSGELVPKPGLQELINWAKANKVGICVVTNAPRENAEMMIEGLGIEDQIDYLLIGAELLKSKPDPFPYMEGMRLLGVDTAHAVAFEDSGPGVRSASSAGLFTFGMKGALEEKTLRGQGASDVLADFTERNLWARLSRIVPGTREPAI